MSHSLTSYQCEFYDLGLAPYDEAYAFQMECVSQCREDRQFVLFCEHPPVITLGRISRESNVLFTPDELQEKGFQINLADRGGDVTLHAPGQLVVYPVFWLGNYEKDLHWYLHKLEDVLIDFLKEFGILANRSQGRTGVWVGEKKIASIGIGVKRWVSYHGVGINVSTDLDLFRAIKPCGMDVQMTSIKQILTQPPVMPSLKRQLLSCFAKSFHLEVHHAHIN